MIGNGMGRECEIANTNLTFVVDNNEDVDGEYAGTFIDDDDHDNDSSDDGNDDDADDNEDDKD